MLASLVGATLFGLTLFGHFVLFCIDWFVLLSCFLLIHLQYMLSESFALYVSQIFVLVDFHIKFYHLAVFCFFLAHLG